MLRQFSAALSHGDHGNCLLKFFIIIIIINIIIIVLQFQKSEFSQGKKEGKKSVLHIIPTQMGERRGYVYDLVIFFKQIFSDFKVSVQYMDKSRMSFELTIAHGSRLMHDICSCPF